MPTRTNFAGLHGGGEDEEFPDELGGERDAGQREHGGEHAEGEEGGAFGEAVEVQGVVAAAVAGDDDEDEEAEEGHQQVAGEIEGDGDARAAEAGGGGADAGDGDEQLPRNLSALPTHLPLAIPLQLRIEEFG